MVVNIVLSEKEYKVVGTRPIRHDGVDKVTGRAKYGGDFTTTGLLFGKILRSPHAHAQIESINIDKALELDGVVSVVTASDLPVSSLSKPSKSLELESDNILARKKVLYKGHAVAAVCATNSHIAEDALKLIEVKYKALDPVIGRMRETERVMQVLSRRTKNNPVLIGEPGVGKTAIVEGLAQKIVAGEV